MLKYILTKGYLSIGRSTGCDVETSCPGHLLNLNPQSHLDGLRAQPHQVLAIPQICPVFLKGHCWEEVRITLRYPQKRLLKIPSAHPSFSSKLPSAKNLCCHALPDILSVPKDACLLRPSTLASAERPSLPQPSPGGQQSSLSL